MNSDPRLPRYDPGADWTPNFIQRFYALWREHARDHSNFEPTNGESTLTLTFAAPGTLAVTPDAQSYCRWTKLGKLMFLNFSYVSSAYATGTAAGALQLTGLPLAPATITNYFVSSPIEFSGITKAGFGTVSALVTTASTTLTFDASGSAVSTSPVNAADLPTGGTIVLRGSIFYRID